MRKDIFLVDMDDTLLDFPKGERENLTQTLARLGILADDKLIARFHAINDALWKELERGEMTRERLKVLRFERLFGEYGFSADASLAARGYWENFPSVCFPFDGALAFLKELKRRGRVYIVTNGGAVIQKKHIELAGFAPYIDGMFISEEIGYDKPSMDYSGFVESHISDYDRSRAVWIGDSLTSDGKCAKDRGIDFILFAAHGVPEGYEGAVATNYGEAIRAILAL